MENLTFELDDFTLVEGKDQTLYTLLSADSSVFKISVITKINEVWNKAYYSPLFISKSGQKISVEWNYDYRDLNIGEENIGQKVYTSYSVVYLKKSIIDVDEENIFTITGSATSGYNLGALDKTNINDQEAKSILTNWIKYDSVRSENNLVDQHNKLIIDKERRIILPISNSNIIINRDNNSEEITFEMYKFYDGIDLSQKELYIYYIRPDGKPYKEGLFIERIDEGNDEDSILLASWVVTENVTMQSGILTFAIVAEGNGYTDDYLWQTYPSNFTIDKGIFSNLTDSDEFETFKLSKFQQELFNDVEALKASYQQGEVKWQKISDLISKLNPGGVKP